MDLSNVFKELGDETRLKILNLLTKQEICVCLVEQVLGIAQPNASKHLNKLKKSGIIQCRKISQWCFYSISEDFKTFYKKIYEFLLEEWQKNAVYAEDMRKLERLLETNDCCKKLLQSGIMRVRHKKIAERP